MERMKKSESLVLSQKAYSMAFAGARKDLADCKTEADVLAWLASAEGHAFVEAVHGFNKMTVVILTVTRAALAAMEAAHRAVKSGDWETLKIFMLLEFDRAGSRIVADLSSSSQLIRENELQDTDHLLVFS